MSNFELYWGGISQGKFAIRAKFFITVDKKWTSFLWPSSLKYNYIAILTITEVDKGQAHADGRIFHCSQIRFDIKLEAKRRILYSETTLNSFLAFIHHFGIAKCVENLWCGWMLAQVSRDKIFQYFFWIWRRFLDFRTSFGITKKFLWIQ